MPTIEQTVQQMITDLGPGGVHEGLPAIPALEHVFQQFGDYSEWIRRAANPPSNQAFDVVLQRYAPGEPGDVEQRIVRNVRASYPNMGQYPIYYDEFGDALEINGWYVTYHLFPCGMPPKVPHAEP